MIFLTWEEFVVKCSLSNFYIGTDTMTKDHPSPNSKFKTPVAKLAKQFEISRNQWKEKALKRAEKIKILEMRVRELSESRDRWKRRAKEAKETR